MEQFDIEIDDELFEKAQKGAERLGLSLNDFIQMLLAHEFGLDWKSPDHRNILLQHNIDKKHQT